MDLKTLREAEMEKKIYNRHTLTLARKILKNSLAENRFLYASTSYSSTTRAWDLREPRATMVKGIRTQNQMKVINILMI